MTYLTIYAIFCLATAISALYEIFWPLLKSAMDKRIENDFTQSPYLSLFVFFGIMLLTAPFMFIILVVPGWHQNCYKGMSSVFHEEKI